MTIYTDIDYSNYNGTLTEDISTRRITHKEPKGEKLLMIYL